MTIPSPAPFPDDAIYFYSQTEAFSEFSNFSPHGVSIDGVWWPTVEHYFQAQKFTDAAYRERIRQALHPKDAKALGRTRALPLRPDWEGVKDDIMHHALEAKFRTHKDLGVLLLSTGARHLVENAPMDAYWGCGPDGLGQNRLGKILMAVRAALCGANGSA